MSRAEMAAPQLSLSRTTRFTVTSKMALRQTATAMERRGQRRRTRRIHASAGILVFASTGITVSGNTIGSTQFGIVTESAGAGFLADTTSVTGNKIIGTQIFDGIDLCSNGNTVTGNEISSSTEAGIHLDSSCASTGNSNTVDTNTINE